VLKYIVVVGSVVWLHAALRFTYYILLRMPIFKVVVGRYDVYGICIYMG